MHMFKYLGTLFTSLADQMRDVKARVAQAMTRCSRLRNIFDAQEIDLSLKLRLWSVCVLDPDVWMWNLEPQSWNDQDLERCEQQDARQIYGAFNPARSKTVLHKLQPNPKNPTTTLTVGRTHPTCGTRQDHLPCSARIAKTEPRRTPTDGRSTFHLSEWPSRKSDGQGRMVRTHKLDSSPLLIQQPKNISRVGIQLWNSKTINFKMRNKIE